MLRRSPTLELTAAVEAARARGEPAYSLSTPTFEERTGELDLSGSTTLLSPALGMTALRERARDTLFGKWPSQDHEVMITAGAKAAIFAALRAATAPGDRVIVVSPHWPSYEDLARLLYLDPVTFPTRFENDFAIDIEALSAEAERLDARAIVLSNPNNPTGRIYSGDELHGLARISADRGLLLLIDESFSAIVFDDAKWRRSICPAHEGLVIVNSFSKSYHLQGLRVGACSAHSRRMGEIVAAHQTVVSATPSLSQAAVLDLLGRDGLTADYRRQYATALDFVRRRGWPCLPADGSFYLFPRVGDLESFALTARANNVYLLGGGAFGPSYHEHLGLCFGKPMEQLTTIFAALDETKLGRAHTA